MKFLVFLALSSVIAFANVYKISVIDINSGDDIQLEDESEVSKDSKAIIEKCSTAAKEGIKSSLATLDYNSMNAEDKARATLGISGMYSAFYSYCLSYYTKNKDAINIIDPSLVLGSFIAESSLLQNKKGSKER